ncbi:MAG: hypothetical protein JWN98_2084 [Abditibacteriota bacterium]|nr:hypothetical protein [Abditibacteriota bacterium]
MARAEQPAGISTSSNMGISTHGASTHDVTPRLSTLIYGGVALGVLAGAALSTYLWRQRVRAQILLNLSPLERAEQLIASCESKLESIENAFAELNAAH